MRKNKIIVILMSLAVVLTLGIGLFSYFVIQPELRQLEAVLEQNKVKLQKAEAFLQKLEAALGEKVIVPGVIQVKSPGSDWITITDPAQLILSTPPAVLKFAHSTLPAVIRLSLRDSREATPAEIIQQYVNQLDPELVDWSTVISGDKDHPGTEAVMYVFLKSDLKAGIITCLAQFAAKRLPGDSDQTLIVIGQWDIDNPDVRKSSPEFSRIADDIFATARSPSE